MKHFTMTSKRQYLAVIGSGGSRIRELQKETGARIDADRNNLSITISGQEDSVKQAEARVKAITDRAGDGSGKDGGEKREKAGGWGRDSDGGKGGKGGKGGGESPNNWS